MSVLSSRGASGGGICCSAAAFATGSVLQPAAVVRTVQAQHKRRSHITAMAGGAECPCERLDGALAMEGVTIARKQRVNSGLSRVTMLSSSKFTSLSLKKERTCSAGTSPGPHPIESHVEKVTFSWS